MAQLMEMNTHWISVVRHDPVSNSPKRRQWLDSNPGALEVKRVHNHGAVQ